MRKKPHFSALAAAGFAHLILVALFIALLAVAGLRSAVREQEAVVRAYTDDLLLAERLRWGAEHVVAASRGYLLSGDPALRARERSAERDFEQTLAGLRGSVHSARGQALLGRVAAAKDAYLQALQRVVAERREHPDHRSLLRFLESALQPSRREFEETLDRFVEHKEASLGQGYARARQHASRTVTGILVIASGGVLLSALLAWRVWLGLTRLYRSEQQAVRAAERACAARDDLLGIVAHDLRSPLSAILLGATVLKEGARQDPAMVIKRAESIESLARGMGSLIKDLLDVAVIEDGHLAIKPERWPVGPLLQELGATFRELAAAKSIQLEEDVKPGDLEVVADRERTRQVLSNLVGNAIKFTPAGGQVLVRAELDGGTARFLVRDTGPGIAPEHQPHLFQRYWQAQPGERKGAGLGLFIAKAMVEAQGGTIWVASTPGAGASFYFTLSAASGPPPVRDSVGRGGPARIAAAALHAKGTGAA